MQAVPKLDYANRKQKSPPRKLSPWITRPVVIVALLALFATILAVLWALLWAFAEGGDRGEYGRQFFGSVVG